MQFSAFREILLKKAGEDDQLKKLISNLEDIDIGEAIIESLEKSKAGSAANGALVAHGENGVDHDGALLHDAISHHLTRFAAINAAKPAESKSELIPKTNVHHAPGDKQGTKVDMPYHMQRVALHPVAAQHLKRAMELMDFASRLAPNSRGKTTFEAVPTNAWEKNYGSNHRYTNKVGETKLIENTKGLNRDVSPGQKIFKDHGYLLTTPHEEHHVDGDEALPHKDESYPFHKIKINGIPVRIGENTTNENGETTHTLGEVPTQYEPHVFDSHPIFKEHKTDGQLWQQSKKDIPVDSPKAKEFAENKKKWDDSEAVTNWLTNNPQKLDAMENFNTPESPPAVRHEPHKLTPEEAEFNRKNIVMAKPPKGSRRSKSSKSDSESGSGTVEDHATKEELDNLSAIQEKMASGSHTEEDSKQYNAILDAVEARQKSGSKPEAQQPKSEQAPEQQVEAKQSQEPQESDDEKRLRELKAEIVAGKHTGNMEAPLKEHGDLITRIANAKAKKS